MPHNDIAVYIHWPWCKRKCPYCDFNSHVSNHLPEEDYLNALLSDFRTQSQNFSDKNLVSIFFGGGTPSLMSPLTTEKLIKEVCGFFSTSSDKVEITLEANPTSSSLNKFLDFEAAGVNRFSIGVQSLQDKHLQFLGREHSSKEALHTVEQALKTKARINFDLIYGLPNQNLTEWLSDLSYAVSAGTGHISAYQLTIEPNTKFYSDMRKNNLIPMPNELQADFFDATREKLTQNAYSNYEISNFAKQNQECKHNVHVWKYGSYLGIGAGAHGRLHNKIVTATQNYKLPFRYIDKVAQNQHGVFISQETDAETTLFEKVLLGIRLQKGIHLTDKEFTKLDQEQIPNLLKSGVIAWENNTLTIPQQHTQLTDDILLKILK